MNDTKIENKEESKTTKPGVFAAVVVMLLPSVVLVGCLLSLLLLR